MCIAPMRHWTGSAGDLPDPRGWGCPTLRAEPGVSTEYHGAGTISASPWLEEGCKHGVVGHNHLSRQRGVS